MFKWLASFDDEFEANHFLRAQARKLTTLGIQDEYSVALTHDNDGYHVNLHKKH